MIAFPVLTRVAWAPSKGCLAEKVVVVSLHPSLVGAAVEQLHTLVQSVLLLYSTSVAPCGAAIALSPLLPWNLLVLLEGRRAYAAAAALYCGVDAPL